MSNHRILIVDDDASVRRVIARTFEREGFEVGIAANGIKAIDLLTEGHFDVMISDIDMPEMGGKELCQHLVTKGPYLPQHTLIVTSHTEINIRAWIDQYPGVRMVEKPIGPRQLLRTVNELIASGASTAP
ncbi:MAG: response regulator [bacterium]